MTGGIRCQLIWVDIQLKKPPNLRGRRWEGMSNVVPLKEIINEVRSTVTESKKLLEEFPKTKRRKKRLSLKILTRPNALAATLATVNCFLADNPAEVVSLMLNILPD